MGRNFFHWFQKTNEPKGKRSQAKGKRPSSYQEPPLDRLALGLPTPSSSKTFVRGTSACRETGVVIQVEAQQPRQIPIRPPLPNLIQRQDQRDFLAEAMQAWNAPRTPRQITPTVELNRQQDDDREHEHRQQDDDREHEHRQQDDDQDHGHHQQDDNGEEDKHDDYLQDLGENDSETEYYSPPPSPNPNNLTLRISPRKNKGCPPTRYGNPIWLY
jgi:hypothetical protein